jgi:SAM-dependent methyltransferase
MSRRTDVEHAPQVNVMNGTESARPGADLATVESEVTVGRTPPAMPGAWAKFVAANKRVSHEFFQPRLYPVSHITGLDWWFRNHVPLKAQRGTLLEFGSGRNFPVSRMLGPSFQKTMATDVEDVAASDWPEGIEFRRCSPAELPFDSAQFDAVVIRSVLEHVEDPTATFREIARVTRPGGRVFMNLPNKWDYVSVIARLSGRFKSLVLHRLTQAQWEDFPVFYRCNTASALRRSLEGTGLSVEFFRPWPSEPAYLKFFVPLYLAGAVYQFAISVLGLDALQPSFVAILRRDDR